ncbi:MAG: hypothetical protein SGJ19_05660 [Planctomycetia bacterium]|nr:hypothetical protein [Planctomycetia bacterium]
MGMQIQVAQSPTDVADLNAALREKFDLACLPRFVASPHATPIDFGSCQDLEQVLFCRRFCSVVIRNLRAVEDDSGRFHVYPKDGLCIEWTGSSRHGQHGYVPGRYFLGTSNVAEPATLDDTKKVMSYVMRTIKSKYTMKSSGRFPVLVGPDLAKSVRTNTASVVYPNGAAYELSEA